MPTLSIAATITKGSTTPEGSIPCRIPLALSLTYTEESSKRVTVAAGATDYVISLDTVSQPTFLLIRAVETDVTVKLSDGIAADPAPTELTEDGGWVMFCTPNGQSINRLLVTTPASPVTGAIIDIISVE